jgi:hypothetical protein
MRSSCHVAHVGEAGNAYSILVRNPERMMSLGRPGIHKS